MPAGNEGLFCKSRVQRWVFVVSCSCRVTDTLWSEVCVGPHPRWLLPPEPPRSLPRARGSALGALVMQV